MKLTPEQQKLVESLLVAANKLVSRHCPGDEDARQTAYLALCKAALRFDPQRGLKASTYCLKVVRGALLDYWYVKTQTNRPSDPSRIKKRTRVSLPVEPSYMDGGFNRIDVQDLLSVLDPFDREVCERYFWANESERTIARCMGCSKGAIHYSRKRILKRLRREFDGEPSSDTSGRV